MSLTPTLLGAVTVSSLALIADPLAKCALG
jgi:hypothetical protein